MIEKIKMITSKKAFHIAKVITIIEIIIYIVGIIMLKYYVEGEKNMPFELNKITIISSQEGIDQENTIPETNQEGQEIVENQNTKWALNINQNNDIYLSIKQNENYGKTEIIKSINIENINIESNQLEKIKLYKPDAEAENQIFINKEENEIQKIEYIGDLETNIKNLKISNQGGLIVFRCALNNIAKYMSDEEQIEYNQLLKKAGIDNNQLKTKIKFDLVINLEGGTLYKTTIELELPIGNVVEEGTTSQEITKTKDYIFKRM